MKKYLFPVFARPLQAVLASSAAAAFLFASVSSALPRRADVSFSFTISQQARQATTDYSYDGYYALRASELVADTLISWLSTPSILKEVYGKAEIPATDTEIKALAGRFFRGKKYSGQNVVVTYSAENRETAAKLHESLSTLLSSRARSLVLSPDQETLFIVTASEPVIAAGGASSGRAAIAGAFVGAFVGLAWIYASRQTKNAAS